MEANMKSKNAALALVLFSLLPLVGGCVLEEQHNAELKAQAERYEQELKRQSDRHSRELMWIGILLTGVLVASNAGWFIAYRRQSRDRTSTS